MPNKELDLVVFDSASVPLGVDVVTDEGLVLSHYVCASLTEDQYGVVQWDMPKILEAMVRFLGEVDKWRAEISAASSLTGERLYLLPDGTFFLFFTLNAFMYVLLGNFPLRPRGVGDPET